MSSFFEHCVDRLTDLLCIISIVGIWPRYLEPRLLETRQQTLSFPHLPSAFQGYRIAHLSDLHLNQRTPSRLLRQLEKQLSQLKPHLILFTGDFLCYSQLDHPSLLRSVLQSWRQVAPVIACAGNHDYQTYVTQRDGQPHLCPKRPKPFLLRALKRLLFRRRPPHFEQHSGHDLALHPHLRQLLEEEGIVLLNNQVLTLDHEGEKLQLLGLSDLWAGQPKPQPAHLILCHNPDSIDLLHHLPGALVLSGHTHGGSLNLPCLRDRLRRVKNGRISGYHRVGAHQLYINRGLGDPYPLRCFSRPELTLITLTSEQP